MDSIQSILTSILYMEKCLYPNLSKTQNAHKINNAFWYDSFNRNLSLDHCEIEVRLGKLPVKGRGPFDTNVPENMFNTMICGLQSYAKWDDVTHTNDQVAYYTTLDESVRVITSKYERIVTSKQKVLYADYLGKDLPFDFRLGVSLEIPMEKCKLGEPTRVVSRKRVSYTKGFFRYDLTEVVNHEDMSVERQVEIELVNLTQLQLSYDNAQIVTMELQQRITNLLDLVEPIRSFHVELLRKRNF